MLGVLIQLIVSWLLLWLVSRKHLAVLGFYPTRKRIIDLVSGIFIATICCALYNVASAYWPGNGWRLNPQASRSGTFTNAWWMLKSVLFEELIFRGALLYLAIQWLGNKKAVLLSAICFGVYHWFSYNLFGNPVQMVFVFIMTTIAGLTFAYAFAITRSLYLPIALHFGWNYVNSIVFPNGPITDSIFIHLNNNRLDGLPSLLVFVFQVTSMPLGIYLYLTAQKNR